MALLSFLPENTCIIPHDWTFHTVKSCPLKDIQGEKNSSAFTFTLRKQSNLDAEVINRQKEHSFYWTI